MGYAEWGTRLAVDNSQPGAEPAEHAPGAALGLGRRAAVHPVSIKGLSLYLRR